MALGIEVKQEKDRIFISQEAYAKKILVSFMMDDYNQRSRTRLFHVDPHVDKSSSEF